MLANWINDKLNKLSLKKINNEPKIINSHIRFTNLPLIYPEKKLILFVSAKAGCTFATTWFFYQTGKLEEALKYDRWIHRYRIDNYYNGEDYRSMLDCLFDPEFTLVKLVRSPYQRIVSSYIHALRQQYENKLLSDHLGRGISDQQGYSFQEFVSYLEATGVEDCNPHHRIQTEKMEMEGKIKINRIIRLEESIPAFRQLEKDFGLPHSSLDEFSNSIHHRKVVNSDKYCGDFKFDRMNVPFSDYRCFYNDKLKDMVATLYACDFQQYGYKINEF